jgi:peptidoglycan-N-acetylglucosamine deacetylase
MHNVVVAVLVLIVCAFTSAHAQTIAFTFDDGPRTNETPLLTPSERNQALLDALSKHQVKAALFVTSGYGAHTAEGLAMAKAWGQAGHALGNHTVSHLNLEKSTVTLDQYQKEILDCDAIISTLPGYQKWFRFTYLREGNTAEKRDGMRAFLASRASLS